jgi:heptose-I-phosphate ethanolaminephosphotransferase
MTHTNNHSRLEKFLSFFASPVLSELPIILVFFILIRTSIFSFFSEEFHYTADMIVSYSTIWCFYAFLISASIYYFGKAGAIIKVVWYIFLFTIYTIANFVSIHFNMDFSPTLFVLLKETNNNETNEFLNTYIYSSNSISVYIKTIIYVIIAIALEYGFKKLPQIVIKKTILNKLWITLLSIFICLGAYFSVGEILFRFFYNNGNGINESDATDLIEYPATDIYTRFLYSLYVTNASSDVIQQAIVSTIEVGDTETTLNDADSLNIVLIIGESYNKKHAEIYDYPLPTTPHLMELYKHDSLFVFHDVITPYNYTSKSIKNMLSCNSIADSEKWYNFPYFPTILRKAGFGVFFWDNQYDMDQGMVWEYALNSYIHNDSISQITYSQKNNATFEYDGELFKNFSQTKLSKKAHNFYIFHLIGQHVAAANRFPHSKEYTLFTTSHYKERKESFLDNERKQKIADYDNATLYNDAVIYEIIKFFSDKNSILVYLSDHGEEIYDYRDILGRNYTDNITWNYLECQFQIPFIIWCSNRYRQIYPNMIDNIKAAVNKPFMTDNLCQLFFNIGGIKTAYYHKERDLLSPYYIPKDRLIKETKINYEDYKE